MIQSLIHKLKHLVVTLRFSILFIFVTLFLVSALSIILATSIRFMDTLTFTSLALMRYSSAAVQQELNVAIRPAELESQFSAHLMEEGVLKDNEEELIPYTYYLLKNLPLALAVYWGDEHGDFIYAEKAKDGSIVTEIYTRRTLPATHIILYRNPTGQIIRSVSSDDLSFDPRRRPWYVKAKKAKRPIWTDVYLFEVLNQPGITSAAPVFNKQGQFIGAFGIDISLDYLSQFITHQKISPHGFSFIISGNENLIAYPKIKPFINTPLSPAHPVSIHRVPIPVIKKSFALYEKTSREELTIKQDGEDYLVAYEPVPDLAEYGWHIGVVIPKKDFTEALQKVNLITIIISVSVLTLCIILVSGLITRIVKPIKLLVQETDQIKHFDLDHDIPIQSRIKEVIVLRNAIQSMKKGLKSFQKYVPKILVRQLIESGEDIRAGGVRRELVVLFSDIENFTTIAEIMDPNELMTQLCDYLEDLSQIIIIEKGTIDKYIGDSIMAFWGAPLPVDMPCHQAAHAALRCQKKLDELNAQWAQQGKPALRTRIGIHKGEAVVGNLGSSERLNYTALGDTINMASRLENINKLYKTRIMVSETVYEEIKDAFVLRLVDCLAVKGKMRSSCVYELLSDSKRDIPFDVDTYRITFEKGFASYQHRQWDEAIAHFKNCLAIYPADTLAPIFIERCEHYKADPPSSDWHGISKMNT
ncbi:cache domain-containing protein [Aquicella lusitana]|uniref:Adenylate cyclase n=1 Tax=Aquicella lusitana TaxID=254246 RepID=A0A370GJJ7_9COXI|nr:adenylate/guanylate cyclase domain-containing protein [Aquicella lusitana]RDI43817.1 adenylate cyclase [Aquicella lusitana]VVC74452.1 Adenylate cyclase 1 [Aquicella lusitana]